MMSLGTVSSTCLPKTQPAGAGETEDGSRTLYQSSSVSSGSFSTSFFPRLGAPGCDVPALGTSSLSVASCDFGRGTRFQPMMSKREPVSSLKRMLSVPARSGEKRMLVLARSWPAACGGEGADPPAQAG